MRRTRLGARAIALGAILIAIGATACRAPDDDDLPTGQTSSPLTKQSATTVDLGHVMVGQTSGAGTETISPKSFATYSDDVVNDLTYSCPDFTIDPGFLPAEVYRQCDDVAPQLAGAPQLPPPCTLVTVQNYQFSAKFHPSVAGAQSCVVTVVIDSGSDNKTVTFTGIGDPPPITINVTPIGALQFGQVRTGTSSGPATVTVRNSGAGTLTGTAMLPPGFALDGSASFALGANQSQQFGVRCTPGAAGPAGGTLTISSNDIAHPSVTRQLACIGVDSAFDISPSPVALAARVGEAAHATVTLANPTSSALTAAVTIAGTGLALAADYSNVTIPATSSAHVDIDFDPTAAGQIDGTLTVATSTETRTAAVTATATQPALSLAPDGVVDFGVVCAGGAATATQAFTLLDLGTGAFTVTDVSGGASPFALDASGATNTTLQPDGANQATFSVTATPTDAGVATGEIDLTTDIPGSAPHAVQLTVTGLPAGTSASPAMLDLGSETIATTSLGQRVTVANCSTDAVMIGASAIGGVDAAAFTIVEPPASSTIAPLGTATWLVVMNAATVGDKAAELDITMADGAPIVVPLIGEGLDPSVGGGDDDGAGGGTDHSYYTCSVGGTGAVGWPVALLIVALRRRRRGAAG